MLFIAALAVGLSGGPLGSVGHAAPSPTPVHDIRLPDGTTVRSVAEVYAHIQRNMEAAGVPSFSRQTKLACSVCHYGFPQLTPFGRLFKLNGYTMTGLSPITLQADSASRLTLDLSPIAPISVMAVASATRTAAPNPGAMSATAQFPQQLSLFASTAISDKMGIFSQFTYEDQTGQFGIDNVDLRFATHKTVGDKDVLMGLTLNNNPTVQDVWNTSPAWSYPFLSSAVAPSPSASTLIDGGLAQSVLGLGAYTMVGPLYAELSGYVSAPQGVGLPLDSSAVNTVRSISPYWRVALQRQFASDYVMVGTFGLYSELYPTGITGPTNQFTDLGFDAQVEHTLKSGMLIGRASFIREKQNLTASFTASPPAAENLSNTLNSYRLNLSYVPGQQYSFTAGVFGASGSTDNVLYSEEPLTGSAAASPTTQGAILEATASPWLNVRIGAQYVMYQKFNGASTNYDVAVGGRRATDNNSLYLFLWLAY